MNVMNSDQNIDSSVTAVLLTSGSLSFNQRFSGWEDLKPMEDCRRKDWKSKTRLCLQDTRRGAQRGRVSRGEKKSFPRISSQTAITAEPEEPQSFNVFSAGVSLKLCLLKVCELECHGHSAAARVYRRRVGAVGVGLPCTTLLCTVAPPHGVELPP